MYDNLRQPKFKRKGKKKAPLVTEKSPPIKFLLIMKHFF